MMRGGVAPELPQVGIHLCATLTRQQQSFVREDTRQDRIPARYVVLPVNSTGMSGCRIGGSPSTLTKCFVAYFTRSPELGSTK